MFWKDFVQKWQLKQVEKPNSQILAPKPQYIFATAFNITAAVDPVSEEWTKDWCMSSKHAMTQKMEEFLAGYNSLEDFVKKQ